MKPANKAWKTRRALSPFRKFHSRPANFVLWWSSVDRTYFVAKRVGKKMDWENREHFIGFFANAEDAWIQAQIFTKQQIKDLEKKIKFYERKETMK